MLSSQTCTWNSGQSYSPSMQGGNNAGHPGLTYWPVKSEMRRNICPIYSRQQQASCSSYLLLLMLLLQLIFPLKSPVTKVLQDAGRPKLFNTVVAQSVLSQHNTDYIHNASLTGNDSNHVHAEGPFNQYPNGIMCFSVSPYNIPSNVIVIYLIKTISQDLQGEPQPKMQKMQKRPALKLNIIQYLNLSMQVSFIHPTAS